MYIKMFREKEIRVQDPLRPGKYVFETRFIPTGASSTSHGGANYEADADGWIEVPAEAGELLTNFRGPKGERFFTPEEVNEEVGLGRVSADLAEEITTAPRGPARVKAPA